MIGTGREKLLWQILTKAEIQQETYADVFLELKEEILKIYLSPGIINHIEINDNIADIYIPKEVKEEKIVRFEENYVVEKNKKLGSEYIMAIKKENNEDDYYLTYEHLLAETLINLRESVLLVGAYGSGKTIKLKYIWEKYIKNHKHCEKDTCISKRRLRILIDVLNENFQNVEELYRFLYKEIFVSLERELGSSFQTKYDDFCHHLLLSYKNQQILPYIQSLIFRGFSLTNILSYKDYLTNLNDRKELEQILMFSFAFCSWVERNSYPNGDTCILIIFDNIDETGHDIQKAIISILEKSELKLPMICACRPETLRNWNKDAIPLITIPHIGPSAYEVVMNRLNKYLNGFTQNGNENKLQELKEMLKNLIEPNVFLQNLRYIIDHLNSSHFKSFFNNLFGWQIRQALRFSQGIIDAAASRSNESLIESVRNKSLFALERIIYRPWGIKSPKLRVVNLFQQGNSIRYRFAGLRVVIFLHRTVNFIYTIEDVFMHLNMFGFTQQDVINILKEMVQSRLVITATKEYLDIETYKNCKHEYIKLSEIGYRLSIESYSLGYIENVMYYCLCNEEMYTPLCHEDPGLNETLKILRQFIKESAEIEIKELENVYKKKCSKKYRTLYDDKTIVIELLSCIIKTIFKICIAEAKKHSSRGKYASYEKLVNIALDFISDYNEISEKIKIKFDFIAKREYDTDAAIEYFINYIKKQ